LPTDALRTLSHRLDGHRKSVDLGEGWERGVPGNWLDALLGDWRAFDTDALQRRLDALRQQRVELGDHVVHLVHAEGRGPSPMPLLLTHGWPGSFLEYLPVLALLADPGAHGADPADAFTVVVPSLPGYGFSGPPPPTGMTGRQVARLWYELMSVGLGYERFVAHGSDLGAGVTAWLARDQPDAVAAIHLATPGLAVAPGPRTPHEEDFARAVQDWTAEEGGYMHEHATKPGTLAAGLSDSPAGLAAWIGEKIVAWSSTRPDGSPAFDRELLLATLTLYWTPKRSPRPCSLTGLIATSPARRSRLEMCRRSPPRSASSAANECRFPSHPESSRSTTTTSPPGLNIRPAATSPPSPSLNCWPVAYATHFARCDTGPETRHHSPLLPRTGRTLASSVSGGSPSAFSWMGYAERRFRTATSISTRRSLVSDCADSRAVADAHPSPHAFGAVAGPGPSVHRGTLIATV
jgi:pimeloyl-ACP methyl ester carboxylesterase